METPESRQIYSFKNAVSHCKPVFAHNYKNNEKNYNPIKFGSEFLLIDFYIFIIKKYISNKVKGEGWSI